MDVLTLSRWQFAITTTYHFLFVPITVGLSIFLALLQTYSLITKNEDKKKECMSLVKFFRTIFLVNFGLGIVTGIVQEFHFGMNWSEYSRFMGDIFGAPLALEALSAFFLESTFLGLWVFGEKKLSPKIHCLTIWLVAFASNLSAFWILVANSFMQHPVGFALRNGRVEMTDFFALITNPYALLQFSHTIVASLVTAGFLVMAVSAYKILQNGVAKASFQKALFAGSIYTIAGIFVAMGTGHLQAQYVGRVQPMKLAAMEALWETKDPAPFSIFAIIDEEKRENSFEIEVPYILSFMMYNSPTGEVKGIKDLQEELTKTYGADNYQPKITPIFWSFRLMIAGGCAMLLLALLAVFAHVKKYSWNWLLRLILFTLPIPFVVNTLGWCIAEMGRQPWIVYGLQKTAAGFSPMITNAEIIITIIGYTVVYFILALMGLFVTVRFIKNTPKTIDEWRGK